MQESSSPCMSNISSIEESSSSSPPSPLCAADDGASADATARSSRWREGGRGRVVRKKRAGSKKTDSLTYDGTVAGIVWNLHARTPESARTATTHHATPHLNDD